MLKLLTVIGARPQIIKAAALSRVINSKFSGKISEVILHTGQHYDESMSQVFFDELSIPVPSYNLNSGSNLPSKQTAEMMSGIEEVILREKPDAVLVFGDTNSTLAGAVAASKSMTTLIHIEAGLRSFNKSMPEEFNRIATDHASAMLFAPTKAAIRNLTNEGISDHSNGKCSADNPRVYHCGDIMYDNSLHYSSIAEGRSQILTQLNLERGNYHLLTIHRNTNTQDPARLQRILEAILQIADSGTTIVFPVHPATLKVLDDLQFSALNSRLKKSINLKMIGPVSFLDIIALEKNAAVILTDSGGVQKEAYFFEKPCIILRAETEWVELVESGNAIIADDSKEKIIAALETFSANKKRQFPNLFGDGNAASFICEKILENLSR